MSDLPPGWATAELQQVADVILGQSPPGASYNESGEGLPFFQGKAEFGELMPRIVKWTTAPKKEARMGDILISVRAPVGPTNLAPCNCSIGRGLAALRPTTAITTPYLLWAVRATVGSLVDAGTGTTFDAVTGAQLRSHVIPVAPLPEQDRIVAAIEAHLSRLDAAVAGLRSIAGRAERVLVARLAETFGRPASPAECAPLESVLSHSIGGCWGSEPGVDEADVVVIRATEFRNDGSVALSRAVRRSVSAKQLAGRALNQDDLLLEKSGGGPTQPVGRVVRMPRDLPAPAIPTNFVQLLRPGDLLDSGFLFWQLWWWHRSGQADEFQRATTNIRNLKTKDYLQRPIWVPALAEQRRVSSELDALQLAVSRIASAATSNLKRAASLRRAMLAAAFSGQLVPQDPADEPASVLLDRIRAERAEQPKAPRNRRKTA